MGEKLCGASVCILSAGMQMVKQSAEVNINVHSVIFQ